MKTSKKQTDNKIFSLQYIITGAFKFYRFLIWN